jgi:hypothetical protein
LNAHGSLAGSVSFRRQFGRVIFQKKPYPVQPNSSAQLAQRSAFATASDDWQSYDSLSKAYYNVRGPQLGMPGRSLYIGENLKSNLPDSSVLIINKILDLQLLAPIGTGDYDLNWYFYGYYTGGSAWQLLASIGDKKNVMENQQTYAVDHDGLRVQITNTLTVPFRYGFWMQYQTLSGGPYELVMRLAEMSASTWYIYFSTDGSSWSDIGRTHLFATDLF